MTPGIGAGLANEQAVSWILHLCVDVVGAHVHTRLEFFTSRYLLTYPVNVSFRGRCHPPAAVIPMQASDAVRATKGPPSLKRDEETLKSTSVLHVYPEEKNLIWWEIRATKELLVGHPLRCVCTRRLRKGLVFLFTVSYHTGKNGHRVKRPLEMGNS